MAQITGSADYMAQKYFDYQKKYRTEPRESDKFLLRLIREKVGDLRGKNLLDIGCHNGNLLYQLKNEMPDLSLGGGDLFVDVIDQCKADPDLAGIEFEIMDVLDLKGPRVDVITINAVLGRFDDERHALAWNNIARLLNPGGWVFAFEWYHSFRQTLRIIEQTPEHPDGLVLTFRSQCDMVDVLEAIGFTQICFYPFQIGIDLPLADRQSALFTHTRQLAKGERLLFRGALYQPWCHLAARKA